MEKNTALLLALVLGCLTVLGGALAISYLVAGDNLTGAQTTEDNILNTALLAQSQLEQQIGTLQQQLQEKEATYATKLKNLQEEALRQIDEAQKETVPEKPKEETCDEKVKRFEKLSDTVEDDVDDAQDDVEEARQDVQLAQTEVTHLSTLIANTTDATQLSILRDQLRDAQGDLRDEEDNLDDAKDDLRDVERKEDDIKRELRRTKSDCRRT